MDAELVSEHFELARRQAYDFCNKGNLDHLRDELESAALLGLVKAGKAYGPNQTAKFSSYAYMAIRNEMLQVLRRTANTKRNEESSRDFAEYACVRVYQILDRDTGDVETELVPTNELSAEDRILIRRAWKMLTELPAFERELMRLRIVEDYSLHEIAAAFGANYSAIQRAHWWILESIRKRLSDDVPQRKSARVPPKESPRKFLKAA